MAVPELERRLRHYRSLRRRRGYILVGIVALVWLGTSLLVRSGFGVREYFYWHGALSLVLLLGFIWAIASDRAAVRGARLLCPHCGKPLVTFSNDRVRETATCPSCRSLVAS